MKIIGMTLICISLSICAAELDGPPPPKRQLLDMPPLPIIATGRNAPYGLVPYEPFASLPENFMDGDYVCDGSQDMVSAMKEGSCLPSDALSPTLKPWGGARPVIVQSEAKRAVCNHMRSDDGGETNLFPPPPFLVPHKYKKGDCYCIQYLMRDFSMVSLYIKSQGDYLNDEKFSYVIKAQSFVFGGMGKHKKLLQSFVMQYTQKRHWRLSMFVHEGGIVFRQEEGKNHVLREHTLSIASGMLANQTLGELGEIIDRGIKSFVYMPCCDKFAFKKDNNEHIFVWLDLEDDAIVLRCSLRALPLVTFHKAYTAQDLGNPESIESFLQLEWPRLRRYRKPLVKWRPLGNMYLVVKYFDTKGVPQRCVEYDIAHQGCRLIKQLSLLDYYAVHFDCSFLSELVLHWRTNSRKFAPANIHYVVPSCSLAPTGDIFMRYAESSIEVAMLMQNGCIRAYNLYPSHPEITWDFVNHFNLAKSEKLGVYPGANCLHPDYISIEPIRK